MASTQTGTANGDPHMVNVLGEKFDLLQRGSHVLIQVPKGTDAEHALLRVEANVTGGSPCEYTFIQGLHITGQWAQQRVGKPHAMYYSAHPFGKGDTLHPHVQFVHIGPVQMKITQASMASGLTYLNFKIDGLNKVNTPVGGLLGTDDHTLASSKEACVSDPESANITREDKVAAAREDEVATGIVAASGI